MEICTIDSFFLQRINKLPPTRSIVHCVVIQRPLLDFCRNPSTFFPFCCLSSLPQRPERYVRAGTIHKHVVLHCSYAGLLRRPRVAEVAKLRRPKSFGRGNYDQPMRFPISREINMMKFFRNIRKIC